MSSRLLVLFVRQNPLHLKPLVFTADFPRHLKWPHERGLLYNKNKMSWKYRRTVRSLEEPKYYTGISRKDTNYKT